MRYHQTATNHFNAFGLENKTIFEKKQLTKITVPSLKIRLQWIATCVTSKTTRRSDATLYTRMAMKALHATMKTVTEEPMTVIWTTMAIVSRFRREFLMTTLPVHLVHKLEVGAKIRIHRR
jgi:hypothetical protein